MQQLRYFVALAETRHFTRAAAHAGVSQPTLSKQIHALEQDLGAPLFHRATGRIELTPAGQALLPRARRILADVETARFDIDELIGVRAGRLRLGATPSLCTSLVAPLLHRFRQAHPGVRLHIDENGSRDLVPRLTRGQLDLAFIVGDDPLLACEPILREDLVVASSAALPPLSDGPLPLAALREHPLVMFRTGYDLRDSTVDACRAAGFEPGYAAEGGEMDAVLAFVEAGVGVAVVPSLVLSGRPGLRGTPLRPPGLTRTIHLAHRRDIAPTHAAQAFRAELARYLVEAAAWQHGANTAALISKP